MHINPQWRVLTVGDGDLSFSRALSNQHCATLITATVLDSEAELTAKYQDNALQELRTRGVEVVTEVDITNPASYGRLASNFDLVIFQFPLVPGFKSRAEFASMQQNFGSDFSINTLNRRLLRCFLNACFEHLLSKDGARLAYISSKDVKPYTEWNIEDQLHLGLEIAYLGQQKFELAQFADYQIRNVDRDKHVKETEALTYIWSDRDHKELELLPFHSLGETGCDLCRAGPFATPQEQQAHEQSAKHKRMLDFHRQWQNFLKL